GAALPWPIPGSFGDPAPAPYVETPGPGKLFSVDRYQALFGPGGIKVHPELDLMVISIAGPTAPFRTLLSNPTTIGPYASSTPYDGGNCTMVLDHSCSAASDANYTGVPGIRLHEVVSSAKNHDEGTSICDGSYDQALEKLSDFIRHTFDPGCIGAPV